MDNNSPSKSTFKTIQIIYTALIFGVLLFTVLGYLLAQKPTFSLDMDTIFMVAIPVVAMAAYVLGNMLYTLLLRKTVLTSTLNSKLVKYQTAVLVRVACIEAPAFLAIAATFMTNNAIFLLISLLMIVLMYVQFPSKEKFKTAFTLDMKEKSELDKL